MDSITQITLGAACGELALGKKIGNRAMFWGAVGGTIPDLDIIGTAFLSPIDNVAFHRGISHSFGFCVLASFVFGYVIHHIYNSRHHHNVAFIIWLIVYLAIAFGLISIGSSWIFTALSLFCLCVIIYFKYQKYFLKQKGIPSTDYSDWVKLFMLALITHPILDCFTTYGTQLFLPFSSYRVSFNNISVADPIYTIPFILFLFAASRLAKDNDRRRKLTWIGIVVSSVYMVFTIWNKTRINTIFENTLKTENVDYSRYLTSPTILNNVLWHCVAETDDEFVIGQYSLFDTEKRIVTQRLSKSRHLLDSKKEDKVINTLDWFSNGYYTVMRKDNGELQINDMRYGTFDEDINNERNYIFRWEVVKGPNGYYELTDEQAGPPNDERMNIFGRLWDRIKGV